MVHDIEKPNPRLSPHNFRLGFLVISVIMQLQ